MRDAVSRPVCRLAGWVLKQTVRSTSSWNQTMHARVDEACPSTGSSGTANVVELFERAASGEGGVENVVISLSCRFQNESSRESVRQAVLRNTRSTMPPPPPPPSGTVLRVDMSSQHSAEMSMGPFFVTRISNPTHQLTDPTQPKRENLDPTRPCLLYTSPSPRD